MCTRAPKLRCQTDEQLDRALLARVGSALEPGRVPPGIAAPSRQPNRRSAARRAGTAARHARAAEAPAQPSPAAPAAGPPLQRARTPRRRTEHRKHLKPQDASARQRREVVRVSWHDTAPETHVDVTPAARSGALLLQAVDGGRRRNAVERHVHERRDAPGRGSTRGVFESFPVGPSGIVDVDVRIDEARETRRPLRRRSRAHLPAARRSPPTAAIRPSRTTIVAGRSPPAERHARCG